MQIKLVRNPYMEVEDARLHETIRKWIGSGEIIAYTWWIAFTDKGEAMGFSAVTPYDRETVYFGPAEVFPEYRGKGLQRAMMDVKIKWCKAEGYIRAYSSTDNDNIKSSNNLIAGGFRLRKNEMKNHHLYWERVL